MASSDREIHDSLETREEDGRRAGMLVLFYYRAMGILGAIQTSYPEEEQRKPRLEVEDEEEEEEDRRRGV